MRPLMLALVLPACGLPDGAQTDAEALDTPTGIVRASATGEAPMHYAKHYAIAETDAVYLVAEISASAGMHSAAFEIFDPYGNNYQRVKAPFVIERDVGEAMAMLSVNGTWISQFDMTGQWACRVFLDNASTELARVSFILR